MIYPYLKQNRVEGFSLVEMLVAVSILLIVIVGPMSVTSKTAKSASYATEQVQAFFLAQEGIELIQRGRDGLLLEQFDSGVNAWNGFTDAGGLFEDCYAGTGCGVSWDADGTDLTVIDCSPITDCILDFDNEAERSFYNHNGAGAPSTPAFTRVIKLEEQGGDRVSITSTVSWRTGSLIEEQTAKVQTYLYNIYAP